jgi:hypothetical protein
MSRCYELDDREVRMLISEPAYRRRVARVLRAWGYTLVGTARDTKVTDDTGQALDPGEWYLAIRSDSGRQRELYQLAMDLWR